VKHAELRPFLRRVATALAGLGEADREELVQMLELGEVDPGFRTTGLIGARAVSSC